ncbi:MAG: LPS export ABC transporter permease LptF [Litorivicinaceae bacterium]
MCNRKHGSVGHLIILRYLTREILQSTVAVSLVLLLVVLSGRFIQFLEKAAVGELSLDLVFTMILWRVPSSLELILPLALTLSILLVLGRMREESEWVILHTAGVSTARLFGLVLVPATLIALVVAWLSLVASPSIARELERQLIARDRLTGFDTVVPGRFQSDRSGRLVYAETLSPDRAELSDVFIVEPRSEVGLDVYLTARSARQEIVEGEKYLVLFDGIEHVGSSASPAWEMSAFGRYVIRLPKDASERPAPIETLSTIALWQTQTPIGLALLQWRMALPIMCWLMVPFAFLIAEGSARQSRYLWLMPVIVLQFGYITALSFSRTGVSAGDLSPWPGLWSVHAIMVILAAFCVGIVSWRWRRG